jgi:hypothetical protein
VYDR